VQAEEEFFPLGNGSQNSLRASDSIRRQRARAVWLLLILVALAFVVRLAFVLSLEDRTYWHDAREYHALATGLVETGHYSKPDGSPTAFWPPGYPLFLALVYMILGPSVMAARVIQALIGAATCPLIYLVGVRLVGRKPAMLAAIIAAGYPLFVYTSGTLYPVTLLTFLWSAILYLCFRAVEGSASGFGATARTHSAGGRKCAAAAGLLAGYLALVTPSALPALLLAALWLIWAGSRGPEPIGDAREERIIRETARQTGSASGRTTRSAWRGAQLALLFLLPLGVIVGAWAVRNSQALGSPVLGSTNGGYNFWLGNHPQVTATTGNRLTPEMQVEQGTLFARHRNEVERDRAFLQKGLDYIHADQGRFVRLSLEKAINLWRLYPRPKTADRPGLSGEALLSLLSYGALLPFALAWLVHSLRRSNRAWLVLLLFLAYTLVHAFFIAKARFRIPIDPYIIIYGAGGVWGLVNFARGRLGRSA
jgi:4-amino-4-deoxy-L-arabinose transferase-like glycosyltransferase